MLKVQGELRLLVAATVACALTLGGLPGCGGQSPASPRGSRPGGVDATLPPEAAGLAFIRDGRSFVVREGTLTEIAAGGASKVAVGYSADGETLMVTERTGAGRLVRMLPKTASGRGRVVFATREGSALGVVRAVSKSRSVYYSLYGEPGIRLLVGGSGSNPSPRDVPLEGTFSGEFDVSAHGDIVYTGAGQNPATVMLRTRNRFCSVATGMATAFTPSFAGDGARICFTGSERAQGPLGLWVADVATGGVREIDGAERANPTFPVFSPDGRSIAVRSATDGAIWIFRVEGGDSRRIDLHTDEAPIGW